MIDDWKFGTVVGARIWPSVRAMLVAQTENRDVFGDQDLIWLAIILRDDESAVVGVDNWTPGDTITLSSNDPNVTIIDEGIE